MDLKLNPTPTLEGPIQTAGTITKLELRDVNIPGEQEPVQYLDIFVKVDHSELNQVLGGSALKVGYPARVNGDTKLGSMLKRFGFDITAEVDLEALYGQRVTVNCNKEAGSDGGLYWRIERDTVMPGPATE